ncbi:WD40 repeat-like protein [Fomitopsis betulina]|nr:WD40 repeat-like protein [Fomitopsis betulina]
MTTMLPTAAMKHGVDLASMSSTSFSSAPSSARRKRRILSSVMQRPLDRVKVLGNEHYGHTGCVNALSWARGGDLLISGGDDTTVRVWRMDPSEPAEDYPFQCEAVIKTGHRNNIFNARMLPQSSRIVTVAADRQVRISDVGAIVHSTRYSDTTEYTSSQANVKVLRCHKGRVKRIVTEESPDMFLTVAEDGTVRQHDLRVPHNCALGNCPAPLVKVDHDLSSIALSPLTPYQFVVAGESPYGHLFDRRYAGRILKEEWGVPPNSHDVTTCVRRFGRAKRRPGESRGYEHVTGVRMATTNGDEVLLSYSSDAVYLYSTHDDPSDGASGKDTLIASNHTSPERSSRSSAVRSTTSDPADIRRTDTEMEEDIERVMTEDGDEYNYMDENADEDENGDSETDDVSVGFEIEDVPTMKTSTVPIVYPRTRFSGACNVETVKDVNFLGPQDEYVVSGSDDGNFFIWRKDTGQLHDILEGDGSVVNVIEGHPQQPLIAVSGIDTTIKLFGPARGLSQFSKLSNADNIMKRNSEAEARRNNMTSVLLRYQLALHASRDLGADEEGPDCPLQ